MMYPSTYLVSVSLYLYQYLYLSSCICVCACAAVRSALYAIRFKRKGQANKQIVAHYACCLSQRTTQERNKIATNFSKKQICKIDQAITKKYLLQHVAKTSYFQTAGRNCATVHKWYTKQTPQLSCISYTFISLLHCKFNRDQLRTILGIS